MHLEQVDGGEFESLINAHDDVLLEHFLADILCFLVIGLDMVFDPSINVAAVHASNLAAKPPILVFLNLDIIPNKFSPVTQLLQLVRLKLDSFTHWILLEERLLSIQSRVMGFLHRRNRAIDYLLLC